jgi:hypothetical protein
LKERRLEVCSQPSGNDYLQRAIHAAEQTVEVVLDGHVVGLYAR